MRYSIYEIATFSSGLAIIAFFAIITALPIEIMIMGEGLTVFWIFFMVLFGIILSFILLTFMDKKYRLLLTKVFDIAALVSIIFVAYTFLVFTADLFEPWYIQVGWFLRYNGFSTGLFLGFVAARTTVALSTIIQGFESPEKLEESTNVEQDEKKSKTITLITITIGFGLFIVEMLLFRYVSFFFVLVSLFVLGSGLLIFSTLNHLDRNYSEYLERMFLNENEETEAPEERNPGILSTINSRLNKLGTRPRDFWVLAIPLIAMTAIGIIVIALLPFNLTIPIVIPYEMGPIYYDIPPSQLFSYVLIVALFIMLLVAVYRKKMNRRLSGYYKKGIKSDLKVSLFGVVDALRIFGLVLVFSQILYFFEYPIYLPSIISFHLLFGIIGGVIYYFLSTNQKNRKILYVVAILLLLLNFYMIFIDGLANQVNVVSGEFDTLFPFLYLFSFPNFILTGIPMGIILSDLFLNLGSKHVGGSDSINRSAFIVVAIFFTAMLFIPGNFLLNNPGGDPPLTDQNYLTFYIFCIGLGVELFIGLVFNFLITEILVPRFVEKKPKMLKRSPEPSSQKVKKTIKKKPVASYFRKKKVIGLSLSIVVFISFMGGFGMFFSYSQLYQRPLLVHSPGNYMIWLQSASERVAKNTMICTLTSPRVDAVDIYLAKNEYAAFQLVWRPLGRVITSLTYQISDFQHENNLYNISVGNFSLRYVDWVLEDEFPDILKPFSSLDLSSWVNTILWFSIKTPYNAVEGEYNGSVTFNFNGGQERIPVRLHVWNFTIPNMKHLSTNIGGRSEDPVRIQNYLDHRLNDYGTDIYNATSLTELNTIEKYTCYLNTTNNTWTFNWTWWDNMTQYKLDQGMNAFTVTYPLGLHDDRVPYINNATRMLWLKNWLSDMEAHLEIKNWLNYSYLYFIDEFSIFLPSGYGRAEYFSMIKTLLSEIKNATTKIKIMTTTPPSVELESISTDYIDIYCPLTDDRDKARWDERLAAGCEFWFYSCIGPLAPWPNVMLYDRLYETRILMWQVWLYQIHGYLFWHSQKYYHGKYGHSFNGYGDGWFLYEQGGNLYDSLRWEMFLEGQEDYEYVWLFNATLDYLDKNPGIIPQNEINSYKSELNAIVSSIVGEKWVYCDHVSTLYAGRDRIGSILNELGNLVNLTSIGEAPWVPPYKPGS